MLSSGHGEANQPAGGGQVAAVSEP